VRTSKVLHPQFLYEIPFYVRGKKGANNKECDHEAAVANRGSGRQPSLAVEE